MARVLIAWELGEAFGHVAHCLQLAEGLRQRGHTVAMALKDLRLPAGPVNPKGLTLLPAPLTSQRPQRPQRPQGRPVNYADVLRHCGFADARDVAARLVGWDNLFRLTRTEVVIGDHAPTALLAARVAGIPHLAVSSSFAIPPDVTPWPSIRPWEAIAEATLVAADSQLDQVTDDAQAAMGRPPRVRIRDLFGKRAVLNTFAELDHYGERPHGRYVGPIVSVPQARRASWQDTGNAKVLAYLRPEVPGFAAILHALARLDAEVVCVAPGLPPGVARRYATPRLRIALAPLHLTSLLQEADLAVGYGSSGFSTQALLAGVPLVMRPRHVEQGLIARRVQALGAGIVLDARMEVETLLPLLQTVLHGPSHRLAARAFRDRHRHFSTAHAVDRSVSLVEHTLLASNTVTPPPRPPESVGKPEALLP